MCSWAVIRRFELIDMNLEGDEWPCFEPTGPWRVIHHVPKRIDHRPNEYAADGACLNYCYAKFALQTRRSKVGEGASTKAEALEVR
jgi:hypothetical protein